jgi:CRISPR-associated endonuclease/helicase Cas3
MTSTNFAKDFEDLTGHSPFPWQEALYTYLVADRLPPACNIPTGLGKTNVIAVWLLALAAKPESIPRRLVYVVNRRTVVDQTTDEVARLRSNLAKVPAVEAGLRRLCSVPSDQPTLAISTLRGQFADNREWSADPSRPAIICGTVDMIGSRLLFSGYGVGFKARPLHAGFLGQDVLLVHDEAHLEPAFQTLIEQIRREQQRCNEFRQFHVMELTATRRGEGSTFQLTEEDYKHPVVKERIHATKKLHLKPLDDPKKLAERLAAKALEFKTNCAVLVFARTVEDVLKVCEALRKAKQAVRPLTGTMRGKERDQLVNDEVFARFLLKEPKDAPTVYLVCTSAGEVGVNISADHLVCDLSTLESMVQRFGRVNRFGKRTDTEIHVLYPPESAFDEKEEYDERRKRTLALLQELDGDASPAAIAKLDAARRAAAFAPCPSIVPTSDMLFDAWALTTIRGPLPGRPEVEPYLHGLPTEWQPPETYVAWRQEVEKVTGDLLAEFAPTDLLSEYPLKPHELLRDRFDRVHKELCQIARRWSGDVWLLGDDGQVAVIPLQELTSKEGKDLLRWKTIILPPAAGGLSTVGMLDGTAMPPAESLDVADQLYLANEKGELVRQRKRIWNENWDEETDSMHEVVTIPFPTSTDDEDTEENVWRWLRLANEGDRNTQKPVRWEVHVGDVEREAKRIVDALLLSDELRNAVVQAARYHDHGKRRALFQQLLGNTNFSVPMAKSGKKGNRLPEKYRHEFGSLLDIEQELASLNLGEHQDLVLHLIAAHHGYARPHFPWEEAFDPERSQADAERVAAEVPRRFARLQRKYGRWGLAYLESLLRAADWAASANPSKYCEESP